MRHIQMQQTYLKYFYHINKHRTANWNTSEMFLWNPQLCRHYPPMLSINTDTIFLLPSFL